MLKLFYAKKEDIPEGYDKLYTEKSGQWVLTGVTGMKSQEDVDKVQEGLRKEREDHKETKDKLKAWGDLDPTETLPNLDRIKELEAAAGGKLDEDKINEIVEGRIAQKTGPLDREIAKLKTENGTLTTENTGLKVGVETRDRNDSVRAAAIEAKVRPDILGDVLTISGGMLEKNDAGDLITKSGIDGVTAGLGVKDFFGEMQEKRAYWWPDSQGGGAGGGNGGGSDGKNPWTKGNWNLTEQGKVHKEDPTRAENLRNAAGVKLGATRPAEESK